MRRKGHLDRKVDFQDAGFGKAWTIPLGLARRLAHTCSYSQPLVREHLAVPVKDTVPHLVNGIHAADSDVSGEFVKVPMQVLNRHPVLDSVIAALEQGPVLLDAAGVYRAALELPLSVVHRVLSVLPRLPIGTGPVRGERGTRFVRFL